MGRKMDESKTVSEKSVIESVNCEACNKEMGVENTQSQDNTLFVWYLCDCGERLLRKYDDNPSNGTRLEDF